jgi:GT2 family glycosyltransferase
VIDLKTTDRRAESAIWPSALEANRKDLVSCFRRQADAGESSAAPRAREIPCTVAVCTKGRTASLHRLLDSLATQSRQPARLLIVDAAPDDVTERSLRTRADLARVAGTADYFRVRGPLCGSARQRNLALKLVSTELIAFVDDDVVLLPDCLNELARVLDRTKGDVVGVGACLRNQMMKTTVMARLQRRLRLVTTLEPGRYCRSGMIVPWEFLEDPSAFVEGDWLPTTAVMWRTAVATRVGFWDARDYSLGEDLDFSLRARRFGRIGVAGHASALHLHDPAQRPDPFRLGYMEIFNRIQIQRRALADRSPGDVLWFVYAWTVDTLLQLRDLRRPGLRRSTVQRIRGRVRGAGDAWRGEAKAGAPA